MNCVKQRNVFLLISLTGIWFIIAGCTSVDTIRLTSQTFPPKDSLKEVEVLARDPTCAHIALAQLSVDDQAVSFENEQMAILKKAAKLGADGVIFHRGSEHVQMTPGYGGYRYGYAYPGWGYGPYGIGGYGYGYGGGMPMAYDTTVRTLKGIAIRYTGSDGLQC